MAVPDSNDDSGTACSRAAPVFCGLLLPSRVGGQGGGALRDAGAPSTEAALPELELVKRSKEQPEAKSEEATSEVCSASDTASVDSAANAKLQKLGAERELEKKVVSSNAPRKERTMAPEEACEEAEQAQGWRRRRDRAREVVVTLVDAPEAASAGAAAMAGASPHGSRRPRRGAQPIASSGRRTPRGRPT
jgi:hypothetical protein